MKKLKILFMSLGILCVLAMILYFSPLKDVFLDKFFYSVGETAFEEPTTTDLKIPVQNGTWVVDETGWRYTDASGHEAKNETLTIGDREYIFDKDGYMSTGWAKPKDTWYYLTYTGQKETGWLEDDGKSYYLDQDGKMVTGWQTIDNKQYHFEDDGSLSHGWVQLDDKYYYLQEDGTMHTGWLIDQNQYYYLDENGVMQIGWVQDQNVYYYMSESGSMVTGWQNIDGKNYYFSDMGSMYTGWLTDQGKNYYFKDNGDLARGWLELNGSSYYMDPGSGVMRTGWIVDQSKAYYLNDQGIYEPNKKTAKDGAAIALTFDDGPGQYTSRLLTTLENNKAKATFFVLGESVDKYPDAIKKMQSMGCQIGNHTYDHTNLTTLDKKAMKKQIKDTSSKVKAITGKGTSLVRPPGGAYNDAVKENLNAPIILWSMDTRDWESMNTVAIVEMVLNNVKDGDIILLHDIHGTTADAADILIPTLKSMGYNLNTVSELAKSKGIKIEKKSVYSKF